MSEFQAGPVEFNEELISKHSDPLRPKFADMRGTAVDSVEAALDGEPAVEARGEVREQVLEFARRFLLYLIGSREIAPGVDTIIGRRAAGAAWAVDPGLIPGAPSAAGLARALGITPQSLQKYTAEARRTLGLRGNLASGFGHNYNAAKRQANELCAVAKEQPDIETQPNQPDTDHDEA